LDNSLKNLEDPKVGPAIVRRKQARFLYNEILLVPDAPYLLLNRSVVTKNEYWRYWLDLRSVVTIALFILVLTGVIVTTAVVLYRTERVSYYVWRLEKRNASQLDQFRNREHLAAELGGAQRQSAQERLIRSLRRPDVPVDRIDLIIALLLQNRGSVGSQVFDEQLAAQFVEALRAGSVDVRTRVHEALRFMFREQARQKKPATTMPVELDSWVPSHGDSPTRLEERVHMWREVLGI